MNYKRYSFQYLNASWLAGCHPCRGVALIAVFWLVLLLSLLALGYATTARLKGQTMLNRKLRLTDGLLLDSSLERGWYEYLKFRDNRRLLNRKEEVEALSGQPLDLWFPRYEPYEISVSGLPVAIKIVSEAGKFNVNRLKVEQWQQILELCGVSEGEEQTTIINSVQDWIDGDDAHRLQGAENDYYRHHTPEYYCKNNDIEILEELLLVRGVSSELFYGGNGRPGLVNLLSVYGAEGKIDVNSADPAAFRLAGELPDDVIEEIVKRRREQPIRTIKELVDVVPQEFYSQFSRYFTVVTRINYLQVAAARMDSEHQAGSWRRRWYRGF
ncbi:MAG: hypothetical protein BZ151_12745 [Desulfobacca sp. 4484_104]|nr:MAG: hypothetical protein BZ151_12745 [Desulfobacca sp. 4484_104]RLB71648.1 MAG: hypothetical protein DRH04_01320 [Deltaproteobacteria bacterium]